MPIDSTVLSRCWNDLYRGGRYAEEPPLRFASEILATLRGDPAGDGRGLYVGCGNGRNFAPLAHAGLHLTGLDVSEVALQGLAARIPGGRERLIHGDFQSFEPAGAFDYLIAIQVLQHGAQQDVAAHFRRVASLVKPGGLFFVRVNSTRAEIFFASRPLDENEWGGFSVECLEGAKAGQPVHFFSEAELLALAGDAFAVVAGPREVLEVRPYPRSGRWAQWEAVFRRR